VHREQKVTKYAEKRKKFPFYPGGFDGGFNRRFRPAQAVFAPGID
jgi:hypothetical protein